MEISYFPAYGRASPVLFICDFVGLKFKWVPITFAYWFTGGKKAYGGLPVVKRSDDSFMKETLPIARYIARHNGIYPSNPLECHECDWIADAWPPVIENVLKWNLEFGA